MPVTKMFMRSIVPRDRMRKLQSFPGIGSQSYGKCGRFLMRIVKDPQFAGNSRFAKLLRFPENDIAGGGGKCQEFVKPTSTKGGAQDGQWARQHREGKMRRLFFPPENALRRVR